MYKEKCETRPDQTCASLIHTYNIYMYVAYAYVIFCVVQMWEEEKKTVSNKKKSEKTIMFGIQRASYGYACERRMSTNCMMINVTITLRESCSTVASCKTEHVYVFATKRHSRRTKKYKVRKRQLTRVREPLLSVVTLCENAHMFV